MIRLSGTGYPEYAWGHLLPGEKPEWEWDGPDYDPYGRETMDGETRRKLDGLLKELLYEARHSQDRAMAATYGPNSAFYLARGSADAYRDAAERLRKVMEDAHETP